MTNLAQLTATLDRVPNCSPQQHADARAFLERNAPDLIAYVFGSES